MRIAANAERTPGRDAVKSNTCKRICAPSLRRFSSSSSPMLANSGCNDGETALTTAAK